jgi:hypothetical protein
MKASVLERVMAALLALGCLALLGVSAWLTPSDSGFGTHEQLRLRSGVGLQPCSWLMLTGKPCATCGMTTAFAHAADGDLWGSAKAQPLGMLLAVTTAVVFWGSLHVAATGSAVGAFAGRLLNGRAAWVLVGLLGASWVYKLLVWPAAP